KGYEKIPLLASANLRGDYLQTAIASVAYQYGPGLATATPNFWTQVTTGHWQDAVTNLNDFGDAYDTRRDREAALIQQDITNGSVPVKC
ncbi:pesticin C-terminus-like muramidase, partial [Xanthomonas vasicola]